MNARLVTSAAGVIVAALKQNRTATGIALALDSARLLMTPETTAELKRLQERVAELEAAPAIVYRAEHESIVMGYYRTLQAAMDHVHANLANEEGGDVKARVIWRADDPEADEPTWECCLFDTDMSDDSPTGYVVTPLEVAAEYDPDADE